jgi:hypothetical protein
MTLTQRDSKTQMQFRSLFYGLWFGPVLGAILITAVRPMLYGGPFWFDLNASLRNIGVVYLYGAVIGYPLFLLLVRYNKLHFVGFTGAGVIAGVVVVALYLFANRVLHWFDVVNAISIADVFCSAIVVSWSVWLVSRVSEFIDRKRDDGAG